MRACFCVISASAGRKAQKWLDQQLHNGGEVVPLEPQMGLYIRNTMANSILLDSASEIGGSGIYSVMTGCMMKLFNHIMAESEHSTIKVPMWCCLLTSWHITMISCAILTVSI